jgi:hypothetical protein
LDSYESPDDEEDETDLNPLDVYRNPDDFGLAWQQGSITKDFLLKYFNHLPYFLSEFTDERHLAYLLDSLLVVDSSLYDIVNSIRSDISFNERVIKLISHNSFGMHDEWSNELELIVGDFGELAIRVVEIDGESTNYLLETEDEPLYKGMLLSNKSVLRGWIRNIESIDSLKDASEKLLGLINDYDVDKFNWVEIDLSQVELIIQMLNVGKATTTSQFS